MRGKLDWGDSSNANSNDFLSDLLPHYVTPRHRRANNVTDEDFHDVILGPSKYKSILLSFNNVEYADKKR